MTSSAPGGELRPASPRRKVVESLCRAGLFVMVTLSPFGLWNELCSALEKLTPEPFLEHLRETYPILLDSTWQKERITEMVRCRVRIGGPSRV